MLAAVVTLQATALAYLYQPCWKALMLMLPLPFTVAALAVGRPILCRLTQKISEMRSANSRAIKLAENNLGEAVQCSRNE